jgi:hypothetical protein
LAAYIKDKGTWIRWDRKSGFDDNYILFFIFPISISVLLILTHGNSH